MIRLGRVWTMVDPLKSPARHYTSSAAPWHSKAQQWHAQRGPLPAGVQHSPQVLYLLGLALEDGGI